MAELDPLSALPPFTKMRVTKDMDLNKLVSTRCTHHECDDEGMNSYTTSRPSNSALYSTSWRKFYRRLT